jgi:hypothetical protein
MYFYPHMIANPLHSAKYFAIASLAVLTLASCQDEVIDPLPEVYITDSLTVSPKQKVLVIETTGTWCQFCPNGAQSMLIAINTFNDSVNRESLIIPFASHSGDPLESSVQTALNTAFPTTGVPNFYVQNVDAGQSILGPIAGALAATPKVGVNHAWTMNATNDTIYVYPKVQFFENSQDAKYYVQSYVLVAALDAKEYSGAGATVDLNQISSVPIVTTGSGATPTKWTGQADPLTKKNAGDIYQHEHTPMTSGLTPNAFGVELDSINPLGDDFFEGDIFGSKFTPIVIKIPLNKDIQMQVVRQLVPNVKLEVATLIWAPRTDGELGVLFVNGHIDHK